MRDTNTKIDRQVIGQNVRAALSPTNSRPKWNILCVQHCLVAALHEVMAGKMTW